MVPANVLDWHFWSQQDEGLPLANRWQGFLLLWARVCIACILAYYLLPPTSARNLLKFFDAAVAVAERGNEAKQALATLANRPLVWALQFMLEVSRNSPNSFACSKLLTLLISIKMRPKKKNSRFLLQKWGEKWKCSDFGQLIVLFNSVRNFARDFT